MILSVLIISHNQKELLRRCIDSVLSQPLPFTHEIIISDDNSTDGTWELAQEYESKHTEVRAYQCNSDDCNPTCTSERSGHNRCNAYRHATGKYFCHIDADDYYRPVSNCLEQMVGLLEKHPECSICAQNGWILKDGQPIEDGGYFYSPHKFQTGDIISARDYFSSDIFLNNGAMMMRRYPDNSPANLFHKWYVDSVITNYHLQFGKMIFYNCADWIYVKYPQTITSSLSSIEKKITWGLDVTVFSSLLFPSFAKYFYSCHNSALLLDVVYSIKHHIEITVQFKRFLEQFSSAFIYRISYSRNRTPIEKLRLFLIEKFLYLNSLERYHCPFLCNCIDKLCK